MANVTVTRPDGSIEKIVLADAKETGYEYYPFRCSDGVIRYALLGEQSNENASHLWVEQNGVKKYVLKSPETFPSGILWQSADLPINKNDGAGDTLSFTVPNKITVLKLSITFKDGSEVEKYIGVTSGKTYLNISVANFSYSMAEYNIAMWGTWVQRTGADNKAASVYYTDNNNTTATIPDNKKMEKVVFEYSAAINSHAVDVKDYI